MTQTNIKLGYIRDPESHEMYFPYTHYLGVVGLDEHVYDLIGGSVDNYIPLAGSSSITGNLTAATNNSIDLGDATHIWKTVYAGSINNDNISFTNKTFSTTLNGVSISKNILANDNISLGNIYAPDIVGNQYDLLMSNGSDAPSWLNFGSRVGYLKKTSSGWSLIGDSDFFFPNEDVWFYQSLPQGVSALDIAVGAQPSGIELNFYGGDGIILKKVVNASQHVLGVQINTSPIVSTLQTLSIVSSDTGYLKKTAANTWELDPYGGGAKESVMNDGSVITASSSATAGLRKQTGTNTYEYQKISFAAITNDTATGNNAVTIILNGNFN